MRDYDFSGYATRNNILCGDGRTIRKNAFKDNDGQTVPLIWNHDHTNPDAVLGHALLENREDGVYAYCKFNDTEAGAASKELVKHGDVRSLSIYANKLKQIGGDVIHGSIRELSLVLAGANPGAYIEEVLAHDEDGEEDLIICYDENALTLYHSDEKDKKEDEEMTAESLEHAEKEEKTVGEIMNTMNEEQQEAVFTLIGNLMQQAGMLEDEEEEEEEDSDMKHNVFDNEERSTTLSHAEEAAIFARGKQLGSLRDAAQEYCDSMALAHSDDDDDVYGITDIDLLFPEATNLNMPPEFIGREMDWVSVVMADTSHSPFARVKSMFADITEDEARAKGYIKGSLKKEEVFSLLKRSTTPTTVYKKQKLDRDDIVDITEFDVVAWIKAEMRLMLDEEIARAILIGDGRLSSDDDHISTDNIRPVVNDADLFTIRWSVAGDTAADRASNFIDAAVKSRKNYRGSGNPKLFTTEDMLTEMLLLKDDIGHKLYKTEAELATALRVSAIVTVPVMEGFEDKDSKDVYGIIANLKDYKVGADKGGAVNMFDDFDIDYNQQKYLIETRCSGALVKPFSAIVLREGSTTASEEPTMAQAMAPFKPQH